MDALLLKLLPCDYYAIWTPNQSSVLKKHLQSFLAHGTLIAMSLAIWTSGRVAFPSAEEFSIFHLASKLITHILK